MFHYHNQCIGSSNWKMKFFFFQMKHKFHTSNVYYYWNQVFGLNMSIHTKLSFEAKYIRTFPKYPNH